MRGPVGSRIVAAQVSQHVPMSPRARTAADITIVYSIRPWVSGRHCASPPLAVASSSWVKVVCSAASVRGTRVLSAAAGVSSPRLHSVDPVPCAGVAACDTHRPTTTKRFHYRQPGQQQQGHRRSTRERGDCTRALVATTIWFRSKRRLQVVEDARRGLWILETSDVQIVERIAVKRNSDLISDL